MEEKYIRIQHNGKLRGKVHILEGEDTKCKLFQNYHPPYLTNSLSYHDVEKPEQNKSNHCCGACFNIKKKKKKKKKLGKLPKVIPTKIGTPRKHKNKYRWYE